MNIGFIGLGKLGLPCALAVESKGHKVYGYEVSDSVTGYILDRKIPYMEEGAQDLLSKSNISVSNLSDVVANSDIIFVSIQTPHLPMYEGSTRLPEERVDFDYSFLVSGVSELAKEIKAQGNDKIVCIISTVLPGTIDREIMPVLNSNVKLCYNPFFIAMGTCIQDFLYPEFVLLGVDDQEAAREVEQFYSTITDAPVERMSIKSAELAKVAYNTFIGLKIVFINTMMEICHKTGANVDDITRVIRASYRRLISPSYLEGGMGDGGGCHPRDNIALSWISRKLKLSYDIFESLMLCREKQTEWIASIAIDNSHESGLPIVILGKSFKPESNIEVGSPAHLLRVLLLESVSSDLVSIFDPYIDPDFESALSTPAVFVAATKHKEFASVEFPSGSIVIDPWRYIPDQEGVTIMRLGE